jgi:hypothetical protein
MLDNPYEPPVTWHRPVGETRDQIAAKSSLRLPAVALIVLAVLAMGLDVGVLTHAIVGDAPKMLRDEGPEKGRELIVANVVANGLLLVIHAIVLFGALQMFKVRSYANAMTAAIVSLIPFCSPVVLVGMPFAIWALVVLRRDGVKKAFRGETDAVADNP